MNKTLIFSAIVLFAVAMISSSFAPVLANNGSNGCENSDDNSKACEKNPNSETSSDETIVYLFVHDDKNHPLANVSCTVTDLSATFSFTGKTGRDGYYIFSPPNTDVGSTIIIYCADSTGLDSVFCSVPTYLSKEIRLDMTLGLDDYCAGGL